MCEKQIEYSKGLPHLDEPSEDETATVSLVYLLPLCLHELPHQLAAQHRCSGATYHKHCVLRTNFLLKMFTKYIRSKYHSRGVTYHIYTEQNYPDHYLDCDLDRKILSYVNTQS